MSATLFIVAVSLLYPFVIGLGQGRVQPRFLAGFLVLAGVLRFQALKTSTPTRLWFAGLLLLLMLAVGSNTILPLRLYPVLVNAAMFSLFLSSLAFPPSIVERFARLSEPDLSPRAVAYTRGVTQVWCVFFVLNGGVALVTAFSASPFVWWFYNGIIAYVLMGLLFSGEYLVRWRFKRRHHG